MDEGKTTNTTPAPQMGPGELTALARRLRARADSVLFRDQPEQQRDLRAAAAVIDQLLALHAEIRTAADATSDEATERHLREMLGGQ